MERTMAVADPSRWEIVRLLGQSPRTVTQLASATGLSVAATCRHLQRLRAVGVVEASRRGKELHCRPAPPETPVGRWLVGLLAGGSAGALAGVAGASLVPSQARESAGEERVRVTARGPRPQPPTAQRRGPSRGPEAPGPAETSRQESSRRFRELEDYLL